MTRSSARKKGKEVLKSQRGKKGLRMFTLGLALFLSRTTLKIATLEEVNKFCVLPLQFSRHFSLNQSASTLEKYSQLTLLKITST